MYIVHPFFRAVGRSENPGVPVVIRSRDLKLKTVEVILTRVINL